MCTDIMSMLAGMLKLVLSKGGKEELRIALHCFKDQLTAAAHRCAGDSSVQLYRSNSRVHAVFAVAAFYSRTAAL
jgi:hypothetical protein